MGAHFTAVALQGLLRRLGCVTTMNHVFLNGVAPGVWTVHLTAPVLQEGVHLRRTGYAMTMNCALTGGVPHVGTTVHLTAVARQGGLLIGRP